MKPTYLNQHLFPYHVIKKFEGFLYVWKTEIMDRVAISYLKLCSTWILTEKNYVSLLVIVLLNATIQTHSVNQLLISWNMHGLPAGAQQGA